MELREYMRILLKRWWIIIPLTLLSLAAALLFSYSQTPTYESTSTFVARLDVGSGPSDTVDTVLYGMDALATGKQMFITYCQVMTSNAVRNEAFQMLGIDTKKFKTADYIVTCTNLPETNVLRVAVQGPSPALVTRFNQAVGMAGMTRANNLYSYYLLDSLDTVSLAETPIAPKHMQNGVLGGVFGLAIGISVALIIEYLRTPLERMEAMSIRHPQIGIYNERYFRSRMEEETNRAHARLRPLSVAILSLKPDEDFALLPEDIRNAMLRNASIMMQDALRQGDIIAYLKPQTYGILLPETPGDEAQTLLQKLHADLRARTFQASGYVSSFVASTGVVASSGGTLGYQALLEKASGALRKAEEEGENTIHLVRAAPRPFVGSEDNNDFSGTSSNADSGPFGNSDLGELGSSWEENSASNVFGNWPMSSNGHPRSEDKQMGDRSDGSTETLPPGSSY